jgi:(2R)-sulfolactate sulfo-lyase subunit beta
MQTRFRGYRRENGRVGVRNHVIILPVDDLSNAACEAVANNIKGTLAIPHPYGRLQFGADLDLHFRTLIGTGSNPNVAAVVVIGIEEQWTKKIVDAIAATGKTGHGFGIELHGDHDTIMRASKAAKEYLQGRASSIASSAMSRSCGYRANAVNPIRRPAAAPIRRWAMRSTSCMRRARRWYLARRPS